jgi:hypothetical protein
VSAGNRFTALDPTFMSPEPHPFHFGTTCGWCPNWRTVHCVERETAVRCRTFEASGYQWPQSYRCADGKLRCREHRGIGETLGLGL